MSTADDLRKAQQKTVENSRVSGGSFHVSPGSSNTATVDQNTATIDAKKTAEIDADLYMQTPEDKARREEQKNRDYKKGKLDKPFKDPDEGDYEKGKFDIQQGDFIEFLMKDVVLASAAYGGDKVFGLAGVATYRTLRWTCRKSKEYIWDPACEQFHDIVNSVKEDNKKTQEELNRSQINSNEYGFSPNDDDTTRLAKQLYRLHQENLSQNPLPQDPKTINKMVSAALDGRLDEVEGIDKNSPTYQFINGMALKIRDKMPADQAKDTLSAIVSAQALNYTMMTSIASSYATAKMLQEQSKNMDKFQNKDLDTQYQLYMEEGRKLALVEMAKMNKGTSAYESPRDLLKQTNDALGEVRANVKAGRYDEKGHTPQTPALDKLDQSLYGLPKQKTSSQLMSEASADMNPDPAIQDALQTVKETLNELHDKEIANNKKRNRFEHMNDDRQDTPQNRNPSPKREGR